MQSIFPSPDYYFALPENLRPPSFEDSKGSCMLPKVKMVLDPEGSFFISLGCRKWAGRLLSVQKITNLGGNLELFKVCPRIQWAYVLKPEETRRDLLNETPPEPRPRSFRPDPSSELQDSAITGTQASLYLWAFWPQDFGWGLPLRTGALFLLKPHRHLRCRLTIQAAMDINYCCGVSEPTYPSRKPSLI